MNKLDRFLNVSTITYPYKVIFFLLNRNNRFIDRRGIFKFIYGEEYKDPIYDKKNILNQVQRARAILKKYNLKLEIVQHENAYMLFGDIETKAAIANSKIYKIYQEVT
jgi:hypothetical protein